MRTCSRLLRQMGWTPSRLASLHTWRGECRTWAGEQQADTPACWGFAAEQLRAEHAEMQQAIVRLQGAAAGQWHPLFNPGGLAAGLLDTFGPVAPGVASHEVSQIGRVQRGQPAQRVEE